MLVMGLDTALQRCSVAILRDGEVAGMKSLAMERGHAEVLAPMVAETLEISGVTIADLDRIGVVVGPGGFTGVRIGLAFARAAAIGLDVKPVPVTSLAALARGVLCADFSMLTAAVVDARRNQVYGALYDATGEIICAPFVASPEQALNTIEFAALGRPVQLVGSASHFLPPLPSEWTISGADDQIRPENVAVLAQEAELEAARPGPLYLRAPDAKIPETDNRLTR